MQNVVIGISGGSASGKTTLAKKICEAFDNDVVLLRHDNYYKAHSDLPLEERKKLNFDHPSAFDTDLMIKDLEKLKKGIAIEQPQYSYVEHTRMSETVTVRPARAVIMEGILIFENKKLRELMDIKVFVDTDPDLRLIRRLVRDVKERGRDFDEVIGQYLTTTKPMHEEFVEPSKKWADIIIPQGGHNKVALSMLIDKIRAILNTELPLPFEGA